MDHDEIKELFITVLSSAKKKYSFKILHYSVMSNHIHLLIEPGTGTSLSKLMQWILSVFAIRFNKINGFKGHVWYDRFKSVIVRNFIQFINTFNYITNNPVKAGICMDARKYIYCGLYELVRGRYKIMDPPDDWIKLVFS